MNVEGITPESNLSPNANEGSGSPPPAAEVLKRYLRLETERLRMRHRLGQSGLETAMMRSYQIDELVGRACRAAAVDIGPSATADLNDSAVIALGGYGRRELAPFSDVDLLFLHGGRPAPALKAFVERTLMLLWDAGLKVGHSFRSVSECAEMAAEDLHSRTALVESHRITGSEPLFARLRQTLDRSVFASARGTTAFVETMIREVDERHLKAGKAICLQEPNVKEGVGGLRDLHAILWVGHARHGLRGLTALRDGGHLTESECDTARRAVDLLLRVRHDAHFETGRHTDTLLLDMQPTLAKNLGYREQKGLLASEVLMRDYYRRAEDLYRVADAFLRAARKPEVGRILGVLPRFTKRRRFEVTNGQLEFTKRTLDGPLEAFDAVEMAQRAGVPLADSTRLAIRAVVPAIDAAFRSSEPARRAFLRLFGHRGRVSPALRALHDAGFLGRFIPEFGRVTHLVQHDYYHRYTVDEHTLRAMDALDDVAAGGEGDVRRFGSVLDEVVDASPLYLGLLFHDIGKGRGGGHVEKGVPIAVRALRRLGLDNPRTEDVRFLVAAHLEMSEISLRRDITEPRLIETFANRVGSRHRLDLLLLVTYADNCAVAPGLWNEWKSTLLWELFSRTRRHLSGHPAALDVGGRERADAVRMLSANFEIAEIERHFAMMPDRYFVSSDAPAMEREFRLVASRNEIPLVTAWTALPEERCSEVSIVANDAPGLLARLAGTLTAHGLDILNVGVHTREDGIAVDRFRVCESPSHRPVRDDRAAAVSRDMLAAISGSFDVDEAIEKRRASLPRRTTKSSRPRIEPRIRFDQDASAVATVVEVRAEDRLGLVYMLAHSLSEASLDIRFAKIATARSQALDVFYVTNARGGKLDAESLAKLERTLLATLGTHGRGKRH